ncbi:MAG: DUF4062 domain-containing protein, partial [Theionarchaea archaeon]|nr:DUF4062 domain-containing protein [Theionarchaea archaeon]
MSEHQRRGIAKVFLSSTYRDLHGMRGHLLNQLVSALDTGAMEKFISRGEGPQTTSLRELKESDIAIFLISHYYGTDIQHCEFTKTCKVDCEMKSGGKSGRISYTWCEYRTAQAEGKPHSTYIVDEGWPSRDGAPKIWKMR